MADEGQQEQHAPKERKMIRHMPFIIKIIEVILSVFAIGLIVDPMNSFQRIMIRARFKLDDVAIIYITIGGYLIINTLFIICHFLGDRIPKRMLTLFSSLGALLHLVAGSIIVYNWRKIQTPYYGSNNEYYPSKQYMDMFLSGAVFTFINSLVFVLEVVLTVKYWTKNAQ